MKSIVTSILVLIIILPILHGQILTREEFFKIKEKAVFKLVEQATADRQISDEKLQLIASHVDLLIGSEGAYSIIEMRSQENLQKPFVSKEGYINSVAVELVPFLRVNEYEKLIELLKGADYLPRNFILDLPRLYQKWKILNSDNNAEVPSNTKIKTGQSDRCEPF